MENNHQKFRFRSNINCSGCIAAVKPFLDQTEGVVRWEVDTNDKDKVLTVESQNITAEEVVAAVQKAGFRAEPLSS